MSASWPGGFKLIGKGVGSGGIYLDLESQRNLNKLADPEHYLSQREDRLVILDESPRVPGLFPSLRGLIDEGRERGQRNGRFCCWVRCVYDRR